MYWRKIGAIKSGSGQLKYPQLFSLAKFVFSISHRNSASERGFSINTHLLDTHRNSTKDDTIMALRIRNDHIASVEGIMNISINKQLLSSVRSARQRYESDLNVKRKLDQVKHSKENNDKEFQNLNEKIGLINEQIQLKKVAW